MSEARKTVTAKCFIEVFDNDKGVHYYPGDIEETLNLDSDAALCFELTPLDRKYALESQKKRVEIRKAELAAMKKEGFENLFAFRNFKKLNDEAIAAQ